MADDRAVLDGFTGVARLFPLPNLVLFPGVDQGLHIFEPRYRQMTADALASDHLIAMVLLSPSPTWDEEYDGRPAIEPVACLGRITKSEKLPDGRYNLRLRGLARLRISEEIPDESKLYRLARGPIVQEVPPANPAERGRLRLELRAAALARFKSGTPSHRTLTDLFDSDASLGAVCDLLGYGLSLPLPTKQRLLEQADVIERAAALVAALHPPAEPRFPPAFSSN